MRRRRGEIEWEIFDLRRRRHRKASEHSPQAVIAARRAGARLPSLRVRPENLLHKLLDAAAFRDVQIGHEAFDRRYRISAKDEHAARRFFCAELIEHLLSGPDQSWQTDGDTLIVHRRDKLFAAAELPELMRRIEKLVAHIPAEFAPVGEAHKSLEAKPQ